LAFYPEGTILNLVHLYISDDHNYVGHHGRAAGDTPMREVDEIACITGKGIRGDRYFGHKEDFRGQITFFAMETHKRLESSFGVIARPVSVYRRNVITQGLDLNDLIGREFDIQGVRFLGTEECRPCYWMDQAFGPGAESALRGSGGLRAKILSDGTLNRGACHAVRYPLISDAEAV